MALTSLHSFNMNIGYKQGPAFIRNESLFLFETSENLHNKLYVFSRIITDWVLATITKPCTCIYR